MSGKPAVQAGKPQPKKPNSTSVINMNQDNQNIPSDQPTEKDTQEEVKKLADESTEPHKSFFEDEEIEKTKVKPSDLIELPDSVKAKLEKRKEARAKSLKRKKGKKKTEQQQITVGKAFVKSTYNNTIVSLTDLHGNMISWASAGVAGFKGPKKATPYAAQIITRIATQKAKEEYGSKEVSVFVRGVGTGREAAVRALNANGLIITSIKDITPIPHNGCRPKKPRRV
jgi:small subunit ribosomal protein S11